MAVALVCAFCPRAAAQHFFSYRLTAGLANYPLHDFKMRFTVPFDAAISKDSYNPAFALAVYRRLSWESYFFMETEYLHTSAAYDSIIK